MREELFLLQSSESKFQRNFKFDKNLRDLKLSQLVRPFPLLTKY